MHPLQHTIFAMDPIPCVRCEKDIRPVVARACRKTVVVYRTEQPEAPVTPGRRAEEVFVECPFCGMLHEYPCPVEPEGRRG